MPIKSLTGNTCIIVINIIANLGLNKKIVLKRKENKNHIITSSLYQGSTNRKMWIAFLKNQ